MVPLSTRRIAGTGSTCVTISEPSGASSTAEGRIPASRAGPSRCGPEGARARDGGDGAVRRDTDDATAGWVAGHAVERSVGCHEQLDRIDVGKVGSGSRAAVDASDRVPILDEEVPGRVAVDSVRSLDIREGLDTPGRNVDPNDADTGCDRRHPDRLARGVGHEIRGCGDLGDHRGAAREVDAEDAVRRKVGDEERSVVEPLHRDQFLRRGSRMDGDAPCSWIEAEDSSTVEEEDGSVGQEREVVRELEADGCGDGDRAAGE